MSEKFIASNGVEIDSGDRYKGGLGYVHAANGGGILAGGLAQVQRDALREFFRAELDTELGRWRDPAHPAYVVYPKANSTTGERMVRVVSEVSGYGCDIYEGGRELHEHQRAASAYFKAHPEPKPAWHDAKPGEVWVFGLGDRVFAGVIDKDSTIYDALTNDWFALDHLEHRSARRIFPEVVSDDS